MVRPIEITDALSKVQAVERLVQDAKAQPEALHQLQKTLSEKQTEQRVTAPVPTPASDEVILHVDEQEEEKRKTAEDEQSEQHEPEHEDQKYDEHGVVDEKDSEETDSHDHIDIKG